MPCPDDEQLARFAGARGLEGADRDAVAVHVDACAGCRQIVGAFARQSAFLARSTTRTDHRTDEPRVLEPGTRLGRYTIVRPLGRGAMGRVFVGLDPDLDRQVAIKVLDGNRGNLRAEASALARLSHANVVTIYEIVDTGPAPFIAMELVDGTDLAGWLAAEPRREPLVLEVLLALGDGIAAVHDRGLVHRDIKPENILVGHDGRVRLGDFGLAACAPVTGEIAGTPAYMAPEQATGARVDARADQVGFATVVWEALTGARPDEGGPPPRRFAAVLERARAAAPEERFPSTAAMVAALRGIAHPRRRGPWIAAAVGLVLASTVAVAMVAREERDPCVESARALEDSWSPSARAGLARQFTGDLAMAGTAVIATIDTHATSWRAARIRTCRDARADGDRRVAAARAGCLDERRAELAAAITVIGAGDRDLRIHAGSVLGGLRPAASCERIADTAVAGDPVRRAAIVTQLARATALERAGDLDGASRIARELVADGSEDLVAEHQLLRARLADAHDDTPLARRALDRAAIAAERANDRGLRARVLAARVHHEVSRRDDLEAAALATAMLEGLAASLVVEERASALRALAAYRGLVGEYQRADDHLREAETLAGSPWLRTQLAQARCVTLRQAGQLADAVERCTAAAAQVEALVGPRHPELAAARANQAAAVAASGDRTRGIALFEQAIEIMTASLGADHLTTLTAKRNVAGLLPPEQRMRMMEEILVPYEAKLGPRSSKVAALLVDMAEGYTSLGKLDRAGELAARATALLRAAYPDGHPDLAMSRLTEAEVALERRDVATAEAIARDALAMFESTLGPRHERLVHALYFMVQLAEQRGDRKAVAALLRRALTLEHLAPDVELPLLTELARTLPRGDERTRLVTRALVLAKDDPSTVTELEHLR